MANGIYIQAEYRGKLIRKIVCNGEACKAAIDALTV